MMLYIYIYIFTSRPLMIHCCFFDITCSVIQINHMVVGYLANISFNLLPDIYICMYILTTTRVFCGSECFPPSQPFAYICMESNRFCKRCKTFSLIYLAGQTTWVHNAGKCLKLAFFTYLFDLNCQFQGFLEPRGCIYINAGHGMFFFS